MRASSRRDPSEKASLGLGPGSTWVYLPKDDLLTVDADCVQKLHQRTRVNISIAEPYVDVQ